ncbi:LOB domain-containing protein 6-like [Phoenix dactylifera]|uniref:LOB domain-containing protein 6-like n=1 Tax=Phoenix dactylifera TaxID=42345 RepID=A0A8B7MTL7_PHODC|nr:LOB domain-containing protein 6-like [Phoenix dactylifera]
MASSSAPVPASSAAASSSTAASASSPCAACKFLRRKCQPDCVFAPYFPPDQPQKFVHVHRVFGASNVTKLLNELHPYQREDAVNSLAYEADMRLRDPVYGCVGVISILQHQLRQLQMDLSCAKSELSKYKSAAGSSAPNFSGGLPSAGVHGYVSADHQIGVGGIGFGREQLFPAGNARDPRPNHHLMMRNYDGELVARLGANGAYDAAGLVAALNASAASIGPLGGQFMKPSSAGQG